MGSMKHISAEAMQHYAGAALAIFVRTPLVGYTPHELLDALASVQALPYVSRTLAMIKQVIEHLEGQGLIKESETIQRGSGRRKEKRYKAVFAGRGLPTDVVERAREQRSVWTPPEEKPLVGVKVQKAITPAELFQAFKRGYTHGARSAPQDGRFSEHAREEFRTAYTRGYDRGQTAALLAFSEECERIGYDPRMSLLRAEESSYGPEQLCLTSPLDLR